MRRWMWIWTVIFHKSFAQIASIPQTTEAPIFFKNNSPQNRYYFTRPSTQISTDLTQLITGTDLFLQNLTFSKEKNIHKFYLQTHLYGSPELFTANLQYGHLMKINKEFNLGAHLGVSSDFPLETKTTPEIGWFTSTTLFKHPVAIKGFYKNGYQLHAINYCRSYSNSNSNLNMGYLISTIENYAYLHLSNSISKRFQTNLQVRSNGSYLMELNFKQKDWQLAYEVYSIRNLGMRNTIRIIYELERQSDGDLVGERILPSSKLTN